MIYFACCITNEIDMGSWFTEILHAWKKNPWLVVNMEVSGRVDLVKYLSNDQSDKSWEVSGYNIYNFEFKKKKLFSIDGFF